VQIRSFFFRLATNRLVLLANFSHQFEEAGFIVKFDFGTGFKEWTVPLLRQISSIIVLNNEACFFELVREIRKQNKTVSGKQKKKA